RPTLPGGVQIVPTYARSRLIRESIATLKHTLIEELIVVTLVILLFLLHFRSTLVPALLLPIAVVLSFIPMKQMGLTANIMSLGGIAIAIGAMVDAAIIAVENVHKRLEGAGGREGAAARRRPARPAGCRPADLLLLAGHHGGVPSRVHAGGHRGPALLAARLDEDVLHGGGGDPVDHARSGHRRDLHPGKDPGRGAQSA